MPLFRKIKRGFVPGESGTDGNDGLDVSDFVTLSATVGINIAITAGGVPVDYMDALSINSYTGITLSSGQAGEVIEVVRDGLATSNTWSWVPNSAIFIGEDGALTQTPPTQGLVRRIGWAITPTSINVEAHPSIKVID